MVLNLFGLLRLHVFGRRVSIKDLRMWLPLKGLRKHGRACFAVLIRGDL